MANPQAKLFQQSLCESRSITDNLDPASARYISEYQKQIARLKGDLEAEKQKCRNMARDHLVELKGLREEHERRLESSLDALNQRKEQEKAMEFKRLEESLLKQHDLEIKQLTKEKAEEVKLLERKLHRQHEDRLRHVLESERKQVFEDTVASLPSEEEIAQKEAKLMNEIFMLGDENTRLEDKIKHLQKENRSQIDLLRRMKQEQKAVLENIVKQNKTDAARDMAKLRLAEQILQERDSDVMEFSQRAEAAEIEREELLAELTALKSTQESASRAKSSAKDEGRGGALLLKRLEELEATIKKLEEEKAVLKQDNATLRKRLVQGGEGDVKINKEAEEKMKRLKKRNADLMNLSKTVEERCKALKAENARLQSRQTVDTTEIEAQVRKALSRHHAKDISEYTRQIAVKDRELQELKRKISKYEVSSGARHETAGELDRKLKSMSVERIKMEKLIAKLYRQLPDTAEVELKRNDFSNEMARIQELSEENERLRTQVMELKQSSETDGKNMGGVKRTNEHATELDVVREIREENQTLQVQLQEMKKLREDNDQLQSELSDTKLAATSSDKKLRLLEEDLEQACLISQELEQVQEHCNELEREVSEARGLLNDKDREICQLDLENKTAQAMVQEKEEEVLSLQEQVVYLKNEIQQGEKYRKELQVELEVALRQPDTAHMAMQTSPGLLPKTAHIAMQTSPAVVPKTAHMAMQTSPIIVPETAHMALQTSPSLVPKVPKASQTTPEHEPVKLGNILEEKPINHAPPNAPPNALPHENSTSSDLFTEMGEVGVVMLDAYDSEDISTTTSGPLDHFTNESFEGVSGPLDTCTLDEVIGDMQTSKHHDSGSMDHSTSDLLSLTNTTPLDRAIGPVDHITNGLMASEPLDNDAPLDQCTNVPSNHSTNEPIDHLTSDQATKDDQFTVEPFNQLTNDPSDIEPVTQSTIIEPPDDILAATTPITTTNGQPVTENSLTSRERQASPTIIDDDASPDLLSDTMVGSPSLFIAREKYRPLIMSPNPDHERELSLNKGDYVYVYGGEHEDGFYFAKLVDGRKGLVPQNYVQKLTDEAYPVSPKHKSLSSIAPPTNLQLTRQYIENDAYSLAIHWEAPPTTTNPIMGYKVYVNGEFDSLIDVSEETFVLLSNIPQDQYVCVSVRTCTSHGESTDPKDLVELNPQYPSIPTNVNLQLLSLQPLLLRLSWQSYHKPNHTPTTPLSYQLYLNHDVLLKSIPPTQVLCSPDHTLYIDLQRDDLTLLTTPSSLSVRACNDQYTSGYSKLVDIPMSVIDELCPAGVDPSPASVNSFTNTADVSLRQGSGSAGCHDDAMSHDVMTHNGYEEEEEEITQVTPGNYYRALFSYDPATQSPNDNIDEELAFNENDIIIAVTELDDDGFFEGDRYGTKGYVPKNMVQEVTDPKELANIDAIIEELMANNEHIDGDNLMNGQTTLVRAIHSYNPVEESPNDNPELELEFKEDDHITVFGPPDEDGFYEGELKGRRGLVPKAFVRPVSTSSLLKKYPSPDQFQ